LSGLSQSLQNARPIMDCDNYKSSSTAGLLFRRSGTVILLASIGGPKLAGLRIGLLSHSTEMRKMTKPKKSYKVSALSCITARPAGAVTGLDLLHREGEAVNVSCSRHRPA